MLTVSIIPAKPAGEPRPATGRHAELLLEITQRANSLIRFVEAERAGIYDGQGGFWLLNSDPVLNTARKLVALAEERVGDGTPGNAR
jgi:hypothetical protein